MKASRGTVWPAEVRAAVRERDRQCVGPKVGMPGECYGALEIDHIASSGAIGKKSPSVLTNAALLCSTHHLQKTLHGRLWRPKLLEYAA